MLNNRTFSNLNRLALFAIQILIRFQKSPCAEDSLFLTFHPRQDVFRWPDQKREGTRQKKSFDFWILSLHNCCDTLPPSSK